MLELFITFCVQTLVILRFHIIWFGLLMQGMLTGILNPVVIFSIVNSSVQDRPPSPPNDAGQSEQSSIDLCCFSRQSSTLQQKEVNRVTLLFYLTLEIMPRFPARNGFRHVAPLDCEVFWEVWGGLQQTQLQEDLCDKRKLPNGVAITAHCLREGRRGTDGRRS